MVVMTPEEKQRQAIARAEAECQKLGLDVRIQLINPWNEAREATRHLLKELGWSHEEVKGLIKFRYRKLRPCDMTFRECLDFLRYVKQIKSEL